MTKTFTRDELLIKYLYDESRGDEKRQVEDDILDSEEVAEKALQFAEVLGELNQIQMKPSDKSVDFILQYSKQFSTEVRN